MVTGTGTSEEATVQTPSIDYYYNTLFITQNKRGDGLHVARALGCYSFFFLSPN